MGKYLELLDAGVRIVARFHSHCPHTARMYYHPPSNTEEHNHHHHHHHHHLLHVFHRVDGSRSSNTANQDGASMASYGIETFKDFDTTDFGSLFFEVDRHRTTN